jgi:ABC-type amino acid transport substrate-binding protein
MRRRILLAGAAACVATRSLAAGELAALKARGSIRIATTGANKPYTFASIDSDLQGFDIDWARAIAARLGVAPAFVRLDWKGILPGLIAHQFDCAMSAIRVTPERAAAFITETHAPLKLVGSYVGGDLAAVFPRHSPELVAAFNEAIAACRADGTATTIHTRWFGVA